MSFEQDHKIAQKVCDMFSKTYISTTTCDMVKFYSSNYFHQSNYIYLKLQFYADHTEFLAEVKKKFDQVLEHVYERIGDIPSMYSSIEIEMRTRLKFLLNVIDDYEKKRWEKMEKFALLFCNQD